MSTQARDAVLSRIRKAIGREDAGAREAEYDALERTYDRSGTLDRAALIELFAERLGDYGAGVHRCDEDSIGATVAACLTAQQRRRIIVPPGLAHDWLPPGFEFLQDEDLPYGTLDASDGAVTGCTVAVASTGSLILRHSQSLGRRAVSLIPDYHLCVVYARQIVETIPEAFELLGTEGVKSSTIISGPSATSDIEMTRVQGVHGPRTLDVVLVSAA